MSGKIEDYLLLAFYRIFQSENFEPRGFVRRNEMEAGILFQFERAIRKFGGDWLKFSDIVTNSIVPSIFNAFLEYGVIESEYAELAGEYYEFNKPKYKQFASTLLADGYSLVVVNEKYKKIGAKVITDALAAYVSEPGSPLLPDVVSTFYVPASGRLVSRKDNQDSWDQIDEDLKSLGKEIKESNAAAETIGEMRLIFTAEIEASRKLISFERFDAGKLKHLIWPALIWLAIKFTDGVIAELVEKLLETLKPLVGM